MRNSVRSHSISSRFREPDLFLTVGGEMISNKAAFSLKFNSAVWIFTTGLQFVVGWMYRRSAVFYLPPGWFGPITWWLALPFAPKGLHFLLRS